MSEAKKRIWPPGFWRDAGRSLNVYGVPGGLFFLYLFWFRFPALNTIYIVTGVIFLFGILHALGWSVTALLARIARFARGKILSGRPWWYRRFTDEE